MNISGRFFGQLLLVSLIVYLKFYNGNTKSNNMAIVKRDVCKCDLCGHEWLPRSDELPVCCASCKNPRWNKKL